MRAFLILLVSLGLFTAAKAADSASGKVLKVLPLLLDQQGRAATSPSLFDRDAYQVILRDHTNQVSAIRFDVLWKTTKSADKKIKLRAELRGIGAGGVPRLKTLETEIAPGTFRQWTSLTLGGDEYKDFGSVAAWRITLWNGEQLLGEQKSFLW